jgi:hypothetical protein
MLQIGFYLGQFSLLFNNQFAFVIKVTVYIIGMVPAVHGTGSLTGGKGGSNGFVVGPALVPPGF